MYFSKIEQTTILEVQERRGNYEGICTSRIQRKIFKMCNCSVQLLKCYNFFSSLCHIVTFSELSVNWMDLPSSYPVLSLLQLSRYKNVVDRTDRSLKITVFHTDDNIQFTGSLIDHLYIDMLMCQC